MGDYDLPLDEFPADTLAHTRKAFLQFFQVVPLLRVVDHVDQRQDVLFPAVPHQEAGAAFHQFIEDPVIFIPAG